MRLIECNQGTEEWLAARVGIATASGFADVMASVKSGEAADRRNYRARLVVERLTGKPIPTFQSAPMRQGTEREPLARLAYEESTGNLVREVGLCLHDSLEAGASPDGLIGQDGGLEIKCPELAAHLRYIQAEAEPPEYRWQIQGGMWITGRAWWDFVSYNPDFPPQLQLVVRRIPRNEADIQKLAEGIEKFMGEVREEEARIRALKLAA